MFLRVVTKPRAKTDAESITIPAILVALTFSPVFVAAPDEGVEVGVGVAVGVGVTVGLEVFVLPCVFVVGVGVGVIFVLVTVADEPVVVIVPVLSVYVTL